MVAVANNTADLLIYKTGGSPEDSSKWTLLHTLSEHHLTIMGVDWCWKTNKIVTAGQDRNAYVWSESGNTWKPHLVMLRINRAATCCRWTPLGTKFAVGSGSKECNICWYEPSQKFWVAKSIKKHKSTILCLDWHPNSIFLVTGAADFKTRVFSAFVKKVDDSDTLSEFDKIYPKKTKNMTKFGELLAEFNTNGWIEAVAWSPNCYDFAFAGHDSTVHFVSLTTDQPQSIILEKLPIISLQFLSEDTCVAGGYDKVPYVFICTDGKWELKGALDLGKTQKKKAKGGAFQGARTLFATSQNVKAADASLKTRHQNKITELRGWDKATFSSCGMDGSIYVWDISKEY